MAKTAATTATKGVTEEYQQEQTSSKDLTRTAATTGGTEENQKQTMNDGSSDDAEDHPYFILFIRRLNICANSEMKISKSVTIGVLVSFKMYPMVQII